MARQKRRDRDESEESAYSDQECSDPSSGTDEAVVESILVSTPSLLGKAFSSCSEFETYFTEFCKRTHQHFYKRTSTTREQRNSKIAATYAKHGAVAPASELFENADFPFYLVSYLCTHAGKPRNRGNGKRPRRSVRPLGCKAKIHVLQKREGGRYFLTVSLHNTEHNHRVGKAQYQQTPRHRLRLDSEEMADVNKLRKIGVARKKILKYIWDNTDSEPLMADVHNLLAKLKHDEDGVSTVSERLHETLNRFCEGEQYGVAHVDIDRVDNQVRICFIDLALKLPTHTDADDL